MVSAVHSGLPPGGGSGLNVEAAWIRDVVWWMDSCGERESVRFHPVDASRSERGSRRELRKW